MKEIKVFNSVNPNFRSSSAIQGYRFIDQPSKLQLRNLCHFANQIELLINQVTLKTRVIKALIVNLSIKSTE